MDDNSMNMGAGWIWVFLIIAVLFGGNFGFGAGNNVAAMTGIATQQDVQNGFANLNTQNVLLSSANNNFPSGSPNCLIWIPERWSDLRSARRLR